MKGSWLWLVLLVLCLGVASGAPAVAFELNLKGEYEWRFRYWGRTGGDRDLFGIVPLQDYGGPVVGLAGPNIYGKGYGSHTPFYNASNMRIVRGGFSESGSEAHEDAHRFTLYPHIDVNKAIHFHAVATLGGYRNKYDQSDTGVGKPPFERYYVDRTSVNAFDTASLPSVEQFKALFHLPWGTISLGMKDFPFGTGATLAKNTRASAFLLVIPYGPLQFLPSVWLSRTRLTEGWNTGPDGAEKNTYFPSFAMIYRNGPIEIGYAGLWRKFSANAQESPFFRQIGTGKAPFDDYTDMEQVYFKYFNGRFFANFEFALLNLDRRFVGRIPSNSICRHYHLETGAIVGPLKISFLGAGTTGFALNNPNKTITCVPLSINYQALQPYEWLMFTTYAGGNNGGWRADTIAVTSDENGQMADAFGFAVRLDYAVAANLNVWGSYMWAHRTEQNGFFAGGTASDGGPGNTTAAQAQTWKTLNGFGPSPNPYVDDGFLGWEIGLGADWKLLENMTGRFRLARWEPGPWFDQAYQAVTWRGGAVVTDGLLVGRDSIVGFQASTKVDF